ncbi:hypothetical protein S7711_09948 [Stachybotrys chartarum IBT 7711]|uniref:Uncharacterized protein n=1 Tax=Stachybotrys chartarum (strain CBS 109288 / IBT 7711) TaxID=1280523 RepID=A0A084ALC5_STACB|nr:hypothetical protein S7711_09948 [Stachybotrys chartarum IBT 7711]
MASPPTSVSDAPSDREPESDTESDSESDGARSPTTKAIEKLNMHFHRFKSTLSTFQSSQPIANSTQASLHAADDNSMITLAAATDSLRRHIAYVEGLIYNSQPSVLGKRRQDDSAGDQEADDEDEPPGDGNGRADGDVPQDAAEPGQLSHGEERTAKRAKRASGRSPRESTLHRDRHGFKIASQYDTDDLPTPLLKLLIKIHDPHSLVAALDLVEDTGELVAIPSRQAVHFPSTLDPDADADADVRQVVDIIQHLHQEAMGRDLLRRPLYFDAWRLSRRILHNPVDTGHEPHLVSKLLRQIARQVNLSTKDIKKDMKKGERMYRGLGGHKGLIPFLKLRCDKPDSFGGLSNVNLDRCAQLGALLDDIRARKLCRIGQLILRRAASTEPEPLALRQIIAKKDDFGEADSLEEFDELLGEYDGCDCEGPRSSVAEN